MARVQPSILLEVNLGIILPLQIMSAQSEDSNSDNLEVMGPETGQMGTTMPLPAHRDDDGWIVTRHFIL